MSRKLYSIDLLKGVSIIFVILTHVQLTNPQKVAIGAPYWIWAAVPVFMVISGYTYAMSAERMGLSGISQWFYKKNFLRKVNRVLLPFLTAMLLECLYLIRKSQFDLSFVLSFAQNTHYGGYGAGGYYNAMIFQLLLIFPLIYLYMKRKKGFALVGFFFMNILYEGLINKLDLPPAFYRICLFRYLFAVSLGVMIYIFEKEIKKTLIPLVFLNLGICFLFLLNYSGGGEAFKAFFIIFTGWQNTSLFSAFYAAGIVYYVVAAEKYLIGRKYNLFFENILSDRTCFLSHFPGSDDVFYDQPEQAHFEQVQPCSLDHFRCHDLFDGRTGFLLL